MDVRPPHPLPANPPGGCRVGREHLWVQRGIHWVCHHCSMVPCCSANARRRRGDKKTTAELRNALLARDGDRCYYCGISFGSARMLSSPTIDHKIARVNGGTSAKSNLVLACLVCNMMKADKLVEEFEEFPRLIQRRKMVIRDWLKDNGLTLQRERTVHHHTGKFIFTDQRTIHCPACGAQGDLDYVLEQVPCRRLST